MLLVLQGHHLIQHSSTPAQPAKQEVRQWGFDITLFVVPAHYLHLCKKASAAAKISTCVKR